MTVLVRSALFLLVMVAACTPQKMTSSREEISALPSAEITKFEADFALWQPCTTAEAGQWAKAADEDDRQALQAASCYAFLVQQSKDKALQIEYAQRGFQLSKAVLRKAPQSALANYLAACLEGLKAERSDTLEALQAVPQIEHKALNAARLAPDLDHGGPDRLLGILYLRAPEPPVSIGDSSKAVLHFHKALEQAPGYLENQAGLAAAFLAEGDLGKACEQLSSVLMEMPPAGEHQSLWKKTIDLLKKLCSQQPAS